MPADQFVYIIDDDAEIRRSTQLMLEASGYVVRSFTGGVEFLNFAGELNPGVVLLDLRMPGLDGLHVLRSLIPNYAYFACIIITGHGDIEIAVQAIKLGAKDFLEKPFREAALLKSLKREFRALDVVIESESSRQKAATLMARLTRREREVLNRVVKGRPNKAIAHELGLSIRTVEMHRANAMKKLGCDSLAEAVSLALHSGDEVLTL
jgi:two-component system, LuxR family, response regulator FixJ